MNYNKKTVKDIDVHGKKVLLRCVRTHPAIRPGSPVFPAPSIRK